MKRRLKFLLITVGLSVLLVLNALAQANSRMSGTVTDATGGVMPGAKVTIRNEATGISYTQTTTNAGLFAFPSLPAGTYVITVEMAGFKTFNQTNIVLEVDTPRVVGVTLEVGPTTDVVTVEGSYERLQAANATVGNVVEQKAIEQLPLNGRNPLALITLEAGAVQRSAGAGSNVISVNGSRDRSFNVTIDGIDANESSVPTAINNIYRLNPDNIKEYKVTTNNATAEEGRNSGASVSIATRGGSNELHGTIFHFLRNDALNSKEFFANLQGTDKRVVKLNQFGFEVGGPIKKNKTFFFGSFQHNIINVTQPIDQSFGAPIVYSPTALSGVFRYLVVDPKTPFVIDGQEITQNSPLLVDSRTGALRAGVRNCTGAADTNCVASYNIFANDPRGIGLDRVIGGLLNTFPAPNTYGAVSANVDGLNTGAFLWNPPTEFRGPAIMARIDHTFNENNSAYARFLFSDYNTLKGDPLNDRPQIFPGDFPALGEVFRRSQNLSVNYRRVISPRVINEFTMGYSRFVFLFTQGEANPDFPNIPPFDFTTISEPFNNTPRTFRAVTAPQFLNNLSIVSGSHVFRTGANLRFYRHVDQRGQPGGVNVTPVMTFASGTRSPLGEFPGLPETFTAPSASNPDGIPGISSVDSSFLLTSINQLLGRPARLQQTFLGDLSSDQFLPFQSGDNVNLHGVKNIVNQYNFYFQDEWKVRPNLTLNYGVRWEINPAPSTANGQVFVPSSPIVGTPGPVSFVEADSWFERDNLGAIGPRIGIAWSPEWKNGLLKNIFGAGNKSVIRVGYGLAFDPISSFQVTSVSGRVPGLVTTCSSTLTDESPFNTTTPGCVIPTVAAAPPGDPRLGDGFPLSVTPPGTKPSSLLTPPLQTYSNAPTLVMFDPQLKLPAVHQWSLSLQRELPFDLVGQAAYIGRRGTHLLQSYDINQINADPILSSFLIMRDNVNNGLNADCTMPGSVGPRVCAPGGIPVPIVASGAVGASIINSAAARTEILRNEAGAIAERIENNTLNLRLRRNQQFNRITYIDSGGDSYYHGLQLTLRKRFSKGLGLNMNYTFAKSIDNNSIDPVGSASGGGLSTTTPRAPVDTRNFLAERARSDFDRRHAFNLAAVWDLPLGKGEKFGSKWHPVINAFLGNWSLNTIYTQMSGEPFSILSGARTSNNAHVSRADIIKPVEAELQEISDVPGPVLFADRSAFAIPEPGENGGPRNVFTAPGYWNVDFGLIKTFQFSERFRLQFRTEIFNAFNHANFDNPRDASSGSPSILSNVFGQTCCAAVSPPSTQTIIQTGESSRVIQFALKLNF
jgi:hypothetical protein